MRQASNGGEAPATRSWLYLLGGALAGGAVGWLCARALGERQGKSAAAPRRRVGGFESGGIAPLVRSHQEHESLYDPQSKSYVLVRDAPESLMSEAAPRPSELEIEVFLNHRRQREQDTFSLRGFPPPGGLGAGVTFRPEQFSFKDHTAVYYYLLVPPEIGGSPSADLLYMTSSDFASKGCEALLSFFKGESFKAVFRIWDWATPEQPDKSHFVAPKPYAALGDYLIPYEIQTGGRTLNFDTIYVVSLTRRVSGDTWVNEVYLHNHKLGVRDRVWSYQFSWPTKSSDKDFWWGPIFEVFPDNADYGSTNLLGFLETLVVQDGVEYQLTDRNSKLVAPSGNGLNVVYQSRGNNSALICD